MSVEHLQLLKKKLEGSKWIIRKELTGDDYSISGIWEVSRPNGESGFNLVFEGLDDIEVLPMEKCYGCHVKESKEISLYFGKLRKSFPSDLEKFIKVLSGEFT